MKRLMTSILVVGLFLGMASIQNMVLASSAEYADVQVSHWAHGAIEQMSMQGIVSGYPDGAFRPEGTVTYGEFIKMAVVKGTGSDVGNADKENWAKGYYDAAIENKYFTMHDIAAYQLNREIPRSDMAMILSSVIGDAQMLDYDEVAAKIKDVGVKTKHEYDIVKVYSTGVLTGYPDNTFRPEATLTRAEAATVMHKLAKYLDGEEVSPAEEGAVLSTKERMATGDSTPFDNWAKSSVSKLPIANVLNNKDDFYGGEQLKYYEIVEDYPNEIKITHNLIGGEIIDIGYADRAQLGVLITNKEAIGLSDTASYYSVTSAPLDGNFPRTFDYIGFFNSNSKVMMLIPNPFK